MAYTIYKNITVKEIKVEMQYPATQTVDFTKERILPEEPYEATVAYYSNHTHGTFYGLEALVVPGQSISIAVNEFRQVIAVVNHVQKKEAILGSSLKDRIIGWLSVSYLLIPFGGFGCWLCYKSLPLFERGSATAMITLGFGLASIWFSYFIAKKVIESGQERIEALAKLKEGNLSKTS